MSYSEKLLEHFNNPRNMGSLDKDDPSVGTGVVGSPECGDVMKLQIKLDGNGVITDAKFKTFGCGAAIASSSLATEWLKGRTLEQAEQLKNVQLVEELSLPPVKIHCSVLAESAIKAAIEDWRAKHGQPVGVAPGRAELPCQECPGKVAFALAAGSAETDRAAPGGNVGAERLAGLRQEAGRVLQAVDKALADTGQVLSPQQGRVLEKALAMLKATVRRDDPDQIVLAMDMVNEAARPVMETRMGTEPGRAMKGKAGQEP